MHILGALVTLAIAAAVIFAGNRMITHKPIKLFGRTFDPFKD